MRAISRGLSSGVSGKRLRFGFALLLAALLSLQAQAARFLVDVGPNDANGPATVDQQFGSYWNNWRPVASTVNVTTGASLLNLIDASSNVTSVGLTYVANSGAGDFLSVNGGAAVGGLTNPSPALLGDLAVTNATLDFFYVGGSASAYAMLSITNLNAGSLYSLRMFGSRNVSSETRTTRYIAIGSNGSFTNSATTSGNGIGSNGIYSGNDSNIVVIAGVSPRSSGEIQFMIQKQAGTYAYLNILEIFERLNSSLASLTASPTAAYGASVTLTGAVSAVGPVYPGNGDKVTVTIDDVSTNATIVGTNGLFSVNFVLGSLTAGTHAVTYSYTGGYKLNATNDGTTTLAISQATATVGSVTASQTITSGTPRITLSGVVGAGSGYAANGETVAVTINGVTSNALVTGSSGAFSVSFPTATLPVGSYSIIYGFAGDANLHAASNTTTVLTVSPAGTLAIIGPVTPSQSIVYGRSSIVLTGVVSAAGPVYPTNGESVAVTMGDVSSNALITGGAGGFAVSFPTAALSVTGSPYVISYAYAGNSNLNAAVNTATTLTVTKATATLVNVPASQSIGTGTASVTLTGMVSAAGLLVPPDGETVTVTISGITSNTVISGGAGAFSLVFPTAGLSMGIHTISYSYPGDANLTAAANATTLLLVGVTNTTLISLTSSSATASSSDLPAANAFDGNSGTRWASSAADNQWICIDLGADITLDYVTLDWETAYAQSYSLRMRTSAQGWDSPVNPTNWTPIASVGGRSGISDGGGGIVEDQFAFGSGTFTPLVGACTSSFVTNSPKGRYLMIHCVTRATGYGNSLWEVKVYGHGSGGVVGPIQFRSAPSSVNLTTNGVTDWKYWCGNGPATLSPSAQKLGGSGIRSGLTVSTTQLPITGPLAFNWSDGTPDAVLSTNRLVNMRTAGPSQASFAVDLGKATCGDIRCWFGCVALITSRTVSVIARYPNSEAATQTLVVAAYDTQYRECIIPFQADESTTLFVSVADDGESGLYVGAVTLQSQPVPPKGTVLVVQ